MENEEAWSLQAALDALSTEHETERRSCGALDLLSRFYADRDEQIVEPIRVEMYHGGSAEVHRRAASCLADIGTPLAVAALEDSRLTVASGLRFHIDMLLRSRQHRKKVKEAGNPIERGRKLQQRLEIESAEILARVETLLDRVMTEELDQDELRSGPVPVPDITEGGLGYRLDFEPVNSRAAAFRVWLGINSVSVGIAPRNAVLTRRWSSPMVRGTHLIGAVDAAGIVRKGKVVEKFNHAGESVARLGTGIGSDYLVTAGNLPEFRDVPIEWNTVEYEPYL